jgi:haloalkane dehalogenase
LIIAPAYWFEARRRANNSKPMIGAMPEIFRTPDERFENLPGYAYEPNYVEVNGMRLHHLDEGEGQPVLCFHGEPSWSFLYRKMLDLLVADGKRVVCPDLVGFGRSDKPTDQQWYTYDRHCDSMNAHLDQIEGLEDVTVVVQDWGGAIGLRWAIEHSDQVGRLVIMNTGIFTGRVSRGFMAWREFAEKTTDLPVGMIIENSTTSELSPEVIAAYEAPFPDAASKAGAHQFPLLVPIKDDDVGVTEMMAIHDALAEWTKPTLVAFSDQDPIFPYPKSGSRFTELIPGAGEQVLIENASHFLQEDKPDEIVAAMRAAFS